MRSSPMPFLSIVLCLLSPTWHQWHSIAIHNEWQLHCIILMILMASLTWYHDYGIMYNVNCVMMQLAWVVSWQWCLANACIHISLPVRMATIVGMKFGEVVYLWDINVLSAIQRAKNFFFFLFFFFYCLKSVENICNNILLLI